MENQELDLNNLGLFNDGEPEIDPSNLPEERSSLPRETPQPGTYRIKLPTSFGPHNIKPLQTDAGQRIQLHCFDDSALTLLPSGQKLNYNFNDTEFQAYDREGNITGFTSEFTRLLKGLGYKGKLATKEDKLKALMQFAGAEFLADVSFSTQCNPKRAAYREGKPSDTPGCGQRYEMKGYTSKKKGKILEIPREPSGVWKTRFVCSNPGCGADVTSFVRLGNYRKSS